MPNYVAWFFSVRCHHNEIRRRSQIVIAMSLAMFVLALAYLPMAFQSPEPLGGIVMIGSTMLVALFALLLGRSGRPAIGGAILVAVVAASIIAVVATQRSGVTTLFYLTLALLLAQLMLRSWQLWLVFFGILVLVLLMANSTALNYVPSSDELDAILPGSMILLGILTLLSWMGSRTTERAFVETQAARLQAEQASAALDETNRMLEARVAERTAELQALLSEREAQTRELRHALAERERLSYELAEISLPILPVRNDVLVVPLIGSLDTQRADYFRSRVLKEIETRRTRTVIIDVTGVPVIDTQVAHAIIHTASAASLLGTSTMLVGVRPEVAQTLVSLGIDLAHVQTEATLQQGLERLKQRPR